MRSSYHAIALLLFTVGSIRAESMQTSKIDEPTIRARQPAGVTLKLELPKTRFYQGEIIDATLSFANVSPAAYHLWASSGDGSGRIPDIAFYAFAPDGRAVADPLAWYFNRDGTGGGLGSIQDLGTWKITLPVNQWLSFRHPGTYRLIASSDRVCKGDRFTPGSIYPDSIRLVSDPITITIDPLSAQQEKRIIAEAAAEMASSDEAGQEAVQTLRYLNTPASRSTLFSMFSGGPQSFEAALAIYAAPDPKEEAPLVLKAIRDKKVKFSDSVIELDANLKTSGLRYDGPPSDRKKMEAFSQTRQAAFREARTAITAAAVAATARKRADYNEVLLVRLEEEPAQREELRAKLVKAQLRLTPDQADKFLERWSEFGGVDFLPLVRQAVAAPFYRADALQALAEIAPGEARRLIVEDLQRSSPHYLGHEGLSRSDNAALLALPAAPIPELEPFFIQQLGLSDPPNVDLLLAAIERYGTPAILPAVVQFYTPHEGAWVDEIQAYVLRFWLRCDPTAGTAAFQRALAARGTYHHYTEVLAQVLMPQWQETALPIVTAALDDPDPEVVVSAIQVLEAHADSKWLDPSIAALQRVLPTFTKADPGDFYSVRNAARELMESARWKKDEAQKARLQKMIETQLR